MIINLKYINLFYMLNRGLKGLFKQVPYFHFIKNTQRTQSPISFEFWYQQKVLKKNNQAYWPVCKNSIITGPKNIYVGIETSPGIMPGCYIQAFNGKIYLGDYTLIAANVGIISANHALTDNRKHTNTTVIIGNYCWLGFGSVVLPNVRLGDYTIVGANAVVTKSFPEGYCVLGGNPARVIKKMNKEECVIHKNEHEYHGYIKARDFENFRKKRLNVLSWAEMLKKHDLL
jgi:acetyltransferase-like isoleucine patch superfamily enzyme